MIMNACVKNKTMIDENNCKNCQENVSNYEDFSNREIYEFDF